MEKKDNKKKKQIRLKIKKARKIFGTAVSRGINKERSKDDTPSSPEEEMSEQGRDQSKRRFSAHANFALCKQLDGTIDFEEGTTGWWSMRVAKGFGSVLANDYDFSLKNASMEEYKKFLKIPIPEAVLKNAYNFRIRCYERLLNSNDIVRSLPYLPVPICFEVFKGIYKATKGLVPMPKLWERPHGGHSVAIIGYDNKKRLLKFINSWGREWGDNGLGYFHYDYVDKYIIEAWASMFDIRKDSKRGEIKNIREFEYESLIYQSIIVGRQPLHVIDVYKEKMIAGWVHFRFDDLGHSIVIEDIFTMPNFRGKGIARQLLILVEETALRYFVPKVVCYIHVQDLLSEENKIVIENLFAEERGYKILPFTQQFRGCAYKVVKDNTF
jgi:GNAT superfamily N-acetyltransferase